MCTKARCREPNVLIGWRLSVASSNAKAPAPFIRPIMPIAHYAYCLCLLCLICLLCLLCLICPLCPLPIMPNMPIITTPRAKDKGKQAAHHIVCEQHAPLFILHRAPASKLVPPSHPILRERKLKPLFRGPETAMQHTGKRQSRAPRPEAYSQKLIVLLKIACAIISTPWHGRERLIVL